MAKKTSKRPPSPASRKKDATQGDLEPLRRRLDRLEKEVQDLKQSDHRRGEDLADHEARLDTLESTDEDTVVVDDEENDEDATDEDEENEDDAPEAEEE